MNIRSIATYPVKTGYSANRNKIMEKGEKQ